MSTATADPTAATARWQTVGVLPLVIATFLPFLVKAVRYALLGSHVPLGIFLVLASVIGAGLYQGGSWRRRSIRIWCVAMILWGTARLVLQLLIVATDLSEAHLQSQVNGIFSLVSAGYIGAGVVLWRQEMGA